MERKRKNQSALIYLNTQIGYGMRLRSILSSQPEKVAKIVSELKKGEQLLGPYLLDHEEESSARRH